MRDTAKRSQETWREFWESWRTRLTLVVALLSIMATLINYLTVKIPELFWLLGGILVTLIALLGYFFIDESTTIKVRQAVEELRQEEKRLPDGEELTGQVTNERVNTTYAIVYGLAYEKLVVHGDIDDTGSVVVTRQSKIVAQSAGVKTLDQYLISEATEGNIELVNFTCLTDFRSVVPQVQKTSASSFSVGITMTPTLMAGESIEFVLVEKTPPGAVTLTYEAMLERGKPFPYECFYWDITRPTYDLHLAVRIPLGFEPKSGEADVWYGALRVRHDKEFRRIKDHFSSGQAGTVYELRLNVKHPLPGLRYAIKWVPRELDSDTSPMRAQAKVS